MRTGTRRNLRRPCGVLMTCLETCAGVSAVIKTAGDWEAHGRRLHHQFSLHSSVADVCPHDSSLLATCSKGCSTVGLSVKDLPVATSGAARSNRAGPDVGLRSALQTECPSPREPPRRCHQSIDPQRSATRPRKVDLEHTLLLFAAVGTCTNSWRSGC